MTCGRAAGDVEVDLVVAGAEVGLGDRGPQRAGAGGRGADAVPGLRVRQVVGRVHDPGLGRAGTPTPRSWAAGAERGRERCPGSARWRPSRRRTARRAPRRRRRGAGSTRPSPAVARPGRGGRPAAAAVGARNTVWPDPTAMVTASPPPLTRSTLPAASTRIGRETRTCSRPAAVGVTRTWATTSLGAEPGCPPKKPTVALPPVAPGSRIRAAGQRRDRGHDVAAGRVDQRRRLEAGHPGCIGPAQVHVDGDVAAHVGGRRRGQGDLHSRPRGERGRRDRQECDRDRGRNGGVRANHSTSSDWEPRTG